MSPQLPALLDDFWYSSIISGIWMNRPGCCLDRLIDVADHRWGSSRRPQAGASGPNWSAVGLSPSTVPDDSDSSFVAILVRDSPAGPPGRATLHLSYRIASRTKELLHLII
jgi:hypothetical protein